MTAELMITAADLPAARLDACPGVALRHGFTDERTVDRVHGWTWFR